jgi:NAD(P)-dependent dehydrogenase (short-subunit alcohol dehydrogenase family)
MTGFAGKVALVTGGSSGIGEASVRAFAAKGAHVVIAARSAEAGVRLAAELNIDGNQASFVATDVASPSSVDSLFGAIMARHGRLDFAFNNAGVIRSGTVEDIEEAVWDEVTATNIKGTWLCMRH